MTPKTQSPTASGIVAEPFRRVKPRGTTLPDHPTVPHDLKQNLRPRLPLFPDLVFKGKGRARNPTPAPASSDDDDSSDSGPRTLAALSLSRSSSRSKEDPLGNPTTPSSTLPEFIVVDTSSPDVDSPASPVASSLRPKPKVSKVDLFGEASSSSEGPISVTEDVRAPANNLLSSAEYKVFPRLRCPAISEYPGITVAYQNLLFKFHLGLRAG
uniref:Uncharacterized protein n=1 Tax=Peronospora matthiolae TaxID=2874970 RepID=A0AAV1TXD1_9STRA